MNESLKYKKAKNWKKKITFINYCVAYCASHSTVMISTLKLVEMVIVENSHLQQVASFFIEVYGATML